MNERLVAVNPNERIGAILEVARTGRTDLIPELVVRLDDEDPAARMYAILALEKFTGTRMGYSYAAPIAQRRAAVKRWQAYVHTLPGRQDEPVGRAVASETASEQSMDAAASH